MKHNLWKWFFQLSIVCLFLIGMGINAQELIPSTTSENVPLTEDSEKSKQVYTQLMQAIYLKSFDKDISRARKLYDELVEQVPNSAFVWYKRAQIRERMQDIKGAEDDTKRSLELNPSYVPANWQLAIILLNRVTNSGGKNIDEVLDALKKVTELDPDHFMAHRLLADIAFQMKEYATAETSLKALTRIVPYDPGFHRRLGDLYLTLKRAQDAIEAFQRVIKIDPNDLQALTIIGELHYVHTEKLDEAENIFNKVLAIDPQHVRANLGLGLVLERIMRIQHEVEQKEQQTEKMDRQTLAQDAEKHLEQAIVLSKQWLKKYRNNRESRRYRQILIDAQYALGNVYLFREKNDKAEEVFKELLAENPEHTEAIYGIASAYMLKEAYDVAETYLRKILLVDPGHSNALNSLGYIYAEQGINLDEAEALIKRALEKAPTNGAFLDSLGWVFFKQGRIEEAVKTLENANQQMPDSAEILMHLGDAYQKNGEPEKARQIWQQAQTIEPDNEEIQRRLNQ